MSFVILMNDNITSLKKDGTKFSDLRSVQNNKIFMSAGKILVES